MKKNKELILENALMLFNKEGYLNVSIRQIASQIGISHSNLIYHYKTKQEIVIALHEQLFQHAQTINNRIIQHFNFLDAILHSTRSGFEILYNYRFFMIDLKYILNHNEILAKRFIELETIREEMYKKTILLAIENGYLRNENYTNEYKYFIEHVKIFSDSWLTTSEIYDQSLTSVEIIDKYANLFARLFYPYCTDKGKACLESVYANEESLQSKNSQ